MSRIQHLSTSLEPSLRATQIVGESTNTRDAQARLEALLASVAPEPGNLFPKTTGPEIQLPKVDETMMESATEQAAVLERRLHQSIRALRRERAGRDNPNAERVLANDALRLLVEVLGSKRIALLAETVLDGAEGPPLIRRNEHALLAEIQQLNRLLLDTADPGRHRKIAALVFGDGVDPNARPRKSGAPEKAPPLTDDEARSVLDMLGSTDPQFGAVVRERLAEGDPLESVRHLLFNRLLPVSAKESGKASAKPAEPTKMGGLTFDLGTNTWVQKDRSWAYPISLGQLLAYEVDGIIDGRSELKARLAASATDPTTGELVGTTVDAINQLVDALYELARSPGKSAADPLLDQRFDMCFATTDGGSTPVAAIWDLPRKIVADVFAALGDAPLAGRIEAEGKEAKEEIEARQADIRRPLADLLAKYPGIPKRHKRAHAALINLGLANQSLREMQGDDGVLPRSKTLLDPATLSRPPYKDAVNLKVRFLFTDDFECHVVTEELFKQVVDKYHFPPNHELVSHNRPIAGSGYLTIDHGKIVGVEDDTIMLKGKMPPNLPPALEILRARNYPRDEVRIKEHSKVIDWESFAKLAVKGEQHAFLADLGDMEQLKDTVTTCAHPDRPAMVLDIIRARLELEKKSASDEAAIAATARFAAELLEGFQIINTAKRDFESGDLPADKNDFSNLKIDQGLAACLVRKAMTWKAAT